MFNKMTRAAVVAVAMMLPVAIHAQRGAGGGRIGGGRGGARVGGEGRIAAQGRVGGGGRLGGVGRQGGNSVGALIDMRRELNLSSRQLVQLDSIERGVIQRNQTLRDRMRTRLDSVRPRTRDASEEEIQRFRAQGDSLRALSQQIVRNDSVARVAAMNVLTDSQRVRVRERMAERRGFAAGRMSTMRGGRGGMRDRGMQGIGPRMRGQGGRGRIGGMESPGLRLRERMRGPDGFGPRFNRLPDDAPMRRFRRPPGDEFGPDSLGIAPRRRQFDDSLRLERPFRRPPADSGR